MTKITERTRHADLGDSAINLVADAPLRTTNPAADIEAVLGDQRERVADTIVDVLHAFERSLRAAGVIDARQVEVESEELLEVARSAYSHESTDPELDLPAS